MRVLVVEDEKKEHEIARSSQIRASRRALAFLSVTSGQALGAPKRRVRPSAAIDPARFVLRVDNELFPLEPGTKFFYEGEKDGIPTRNEMYVTRDTEQILGVTCVVVKGFAYEDGVLAERTVHWSVLTNIDALAVPQTVEVTDPTATGQKEGYYRLVKPQPAKLTEHQSA